MDEFQVDAAWLNAGARPVIDVMMTEQRSEDGKEVVGQKRDKDTGMLSWRVEFPFKSPEMRRASVCSVTVLAASEPDLIDRIPVFSVVRGRRWHMGDRSGISYSAASVSAAGEKPSTKRAKAAPPPVPNGADPAPVGKS